MRHLVSTSGWGGQEGRAHFFGDLRYIVGRATIREYNLGQYPIHYAFAQGAKAALQVWCGIQGRDDYGNWGGQGNSRNFRIKTGVKLECDAYIYRKRG